MGPIVLASPDLRPSVLAVAKALLDSGLLRKYVTTLAASGSVARRWKLSRVLRSRQIPDWLEGRVETIPQREIVRYLTQKMGFSEIFCDRVWEWAEAGFDRAVARRWAGVVPCLYGCENSALHTFREQKRRGGLNVLWQVAAHFQVFDEFVSTEMDRYSEGMTPYFRHAMKMAPKINARKREQFDLTDLIVANSPFVAQTFVTAGVPASKIAIVPTPCPQVNKVKDWRAFDLDRKGPIIFLSAGIQNIRKGSHLLLDAWRKLGPTRDAELWMIGKMELPKNLLANLPKNVVILPPISRAELSEKFLRSSVFVMPTLSEGRAHVVLEALSHGLPIVTTPNSGCADVVQSGVNGWLIPNKDSEALTEKLAWSIDNRDRLRSMGLASIEIAKKWQMADFSKLHGSVIEEFLVTNKVLNRINGSLCAAS